MKLTKIISASSTNQLNSKIDKLIAEGWEPIGSHSAVLIHSQNRYSGAQHMDTIHETEYSITMIKNINLPVIEVDVAFYHPEDDESNICYDEEGMREEFEHKLSNLIKS